MAKKTRKTGKDRDRPDIQEPDEKGMGEDQTEFAQTSGEDPPTDRFDQIKQWFQRARDGQHQWRTDARVCYDFVAGHQWDDEDAAKLKLESRPCVTFNRVGSVADSVMGLEITNRQEVRFIPRQIGASGVNELLTDAGKWVRDECNAEDEESDAFGDLITCGVGCTETRLDYDEEPDGKMIIERVDPLEMYWDSTARKRNLGDARHIFRIKQVGIEQAQEMFPDENPNDLDAVWAKNVEGDASSPHDATAAPYYRIDQSPDIDKRTALITMVECQWWEHVTKYRVADPMTGKATTLDKKDYNKFKERAKTLGMPVISAPMKTRRYQRAILGSKILKTWDGPDKGGFTYKFMTGKRDRNHNTWYGLIRAMIDPQKWANKWLAQVMHIINANAKGGLFAEADAFENPQEAEETYATPNAITTLNPGGLEKIREKTMFQFPAGIDHLMQFAISSIRDVSGVNLELLGMANKDQAGILEHQRKQAGMTILAGFFDALREYRKDQGRLMLYYITNYLSDGRLIRIGGEGDGQYVPLVHEPGLIEYDVIVDTAPTSANQKELAWVTISQMMPFLAKMGMPVPVLLDVMQYSPLPSALVGQIKKTLEEQSKQPKPPDPNAIKAQAEMEHAKIGLETAKIKGQADTLRSQAAIMKSQGEMAAAQGQGEQAKAQTFATYAQGYKSMADANAVNQNQPLEAMALLMDALDQAHSQEMSKREHVLSVEQANKPAARPAA